MNLFSKVQQLPLPFAMKTFLLYNNSFETQKRDDDDDYGSDRYVRDELDDDSNESDYCYDDDVEFFLSYLDYCMNGQSSEDEDKLEDENRDYGDSINDDDDEEEDDDDEDDNDDGDDDDNDGWITCDSLDNSDEFYEEN